MLICLFRARHYVVHPRSSLAGSDVLGPHRVLDHAVAAKKRGQSNSNVADLIDPLGDVPMKTNDEIIVEPRMPLVCLECA